MIHQRALTLKQLRALVATVDAGSITAAARVLNVTPPAVSTQIRGLEDIVGARALERGPGGRMRLTRAGAELLAVAREIETALDLCSQRLAAMRTGEPGPEGVAREPVGGP